MIELPFFDTFKKEELAVEPQLDVIGVVTVAELRKEYIKLGKLQVGVDGTTPIYRTNDWPLGVQESTVDNTIVSRTYTELEFDDNAIDFDFFTDGSGSGSTEDNYWRVIHRFTEKEYYSDNTTEFQNFKLWELNYHRWQQEIIYDHIEIANITWNRTKLSVPRESNTTGGGTTGQPQVTTYFCPVLSLDNPPNETGKSSVFSEGTGEDLACYRWDSIDIPFSVTFSLGEALGGFVESDGSIDTIILKSDPTPRLLNPTSEDEVYNSPFSFDVNNPLKYSKSYLEVVINNPTRTLPTYIRIKRYGVEVNRVPIPYQRDEEPEILEHTEETEYIAHTNDLTTPTRYKPPNRYDFPDNFWNDTEVTELEGFGNRIGQAGGIV